MILCRAAWDFTALLCEGRPEGRGWSDAGLLLNTAGSGQADAQALRQTPCAAQPNVQGWKTALRNGRRGSERLGGADPLRFEQLSWQLSTAGYF